MTPPSDSLHLTDRVAIVTGGGTGIGAATARLFAEHGADVILAARKPERLYAMAKEIAKDTGRRVIALPTDVRDEESVNALIEATAKEFGRIDILINNAGGARMEPLKDTPPDRWHNMVQLNLTSAYLCSRAALPYLEKSPAASIVSMSSGAGVTGVKGGAGYSAAKAGLQMFTRVMAAEWGPKGIRANAIAVGGVASEQSVRAWERIGQTPEQMGANVAMRRIGEPIDIALGALYFVSDMSTWVTGQTIGIDGGPNLGGISDDLL